MIPTNESAHMLYSFFGDLYYDDPYSYPETHELLEIVRNKDEKNNGIYSKNGIWTMVNFKENNIPIQGWKIHVSATLKNYKKILEIVARYTIDNEIPFKFSGDTELFKLVNNKSSSRVLAGKYITIYPSDDNQFKSILEDLYVKLIKFDGPYILSDRRYKNCKVLYYRYGNLQYQTELNIRGERNSYLLSPDGKKESDNRKSFWSLPAWVRDPFEKELNEVKGSTVLLNNKYQVIKPISFSATGGVYEGINTINGQDVIIKEARPFTGQIGMHDAVSRLKNESDKLLMLHELGYTPQSIDYFQEWEHYFLIQEKIEGDTLGHYIINNNPLTRGVRESLVASKYKTSIPNIWLNIARSLKCIFEKGIVLNDISINNVLINETKDLLNPKITFIDLEAAYSPDSEEHINLFTPGYRLYDDIEMNPFEREVLRIGLLYLSTVFPFNSIFELDKNKALSIVKLMEKEIDLPSYCFELLQGILNKDIRSVDGIISVLENKSYEFKKHNPQPDTITDINCMITHIEKSIYNSIDFKRKDRLFPGDVALYFTNPLSILYGSYGILYCLNKNQKSMTNENFNRALAWSLKTEVDIKNYTSGLYVGLSGIAWVQCQLGLVEEGQKNMDKANKSSLLNESSDLFYGIAGVGMANLYVYNTTRKVNYLDEAIRIGNELINRAIVDEDGGMYWKDGNNQTYFSYGMGSSGIAQYLLYLYLETNNNEYLSVGKKALEHDLSNMITNEEGMLAIRRGTKDNISITQSPYLFDGLAGIGTALIRYWYVTGESRYLDLLEDIVENLHFKFTFHSSLMRGITGIGNFLLDFYQITGDKEIKSRVLEIVKGFDIHLIKSEDEWSLPGDQLFRVSHDYGTGGAGTLLFLKRVLEMDSGFNNNNFMLDEFYLHIEN